MSAPVPRSGVPVGTSASPVPRRARAGVRARAGALATVAVAVALCAMGTAGAALLPELGERRVAPGARLELPVVAGEPDASVYVERSPLGAELVADGPGRWTLLWEVPSRISERTVIRLGAVDRSDRARRESRELVLVRDDGTSAPVDAPVGAAAAATDPLLIPEIPPLTLVAGRSWGLTVPVRGAADPSPILELRGAPAGLSASPAGGGRYALRWRPGPSVTGTWTVELVAVDPADPERRARRRLELRVRPAVVEVPAATREPGLAPAPGADPGPGPDPGLGPVAAPELAELTNYVVNAGQDVAFTVDTLGADLATVQIDRLPRGARFDANPDGSRTFYWPTSDRDQGEHRFRFRAENPADPSLADSADVLIVVGDPSRARTVPAGDPLPGAPTR